MRDRKTTITKNKKRLVIDACLKIVTMVKHLIDEEGNILSFADFQEGFPSMRLDFLTYHRFVSPVMTCRGGWGGGGGGIGSENTTVLDSDSKLWSVNLKRGSRGVYSILVMASFLADGH